MEANAELANKCAKAKAEKQADEHMTEFTSGRKGNTKAAEGSAARSTVGVAGDLPPQGRLILARFKMLRQQN